MTKEELKEKVELLDEEVQKIWYESLDRKDGWEWYKNHPTLKEYSKTMREYRLVQDYKLSDMNELDKECRMSMGDFVDGCEAGGFSDSDGCAYYATETQVSNIGISPSDIRANKYRKDFDYVCWYNK